MTNKLLDIVTYADELMIDSMHAREHVQGVANGYGGHVRNVSEADSGELDYMIDFPDMVHAASFADTVRKWFDLVDILPGEAHTTLHGPVTLTAVTLHN